MSEPNPYESPREAEPLTRGKVVKRGIGVGVILVLTPVAVAIAGLISCGAAQGYANEVYTENMRNFDLHLLIGYAIAFVPPIVVFCAMIWWAVRNPAKRRNR